MSTRISGENLLREWMNEHPGQWQDAEWIPLRQALTIDSYREWLGKGYHADMEYLERHFVLKADPRGLLPHAQSLILLTKSYVPAVEPHGLLPGLRIASYAKGRDYHDVFGDELRAFAAELSARFPEHQFRAGTDSMPVLERDFARQAGLGWIGKNTCLIHPKKGSLFFIGAILSTVAVENQVAELPDFCGTCTRCLEICPTQAFEAPRQLNAAKCISYWTIEAKTAPPPELAAKFGDWFFGCDLCQSVCPWNQKPFRGEAVLNLEVVRTFPHPEDRDQTLHDLRFCLTASDAELKSHLATSPLSRAKSFGLRRNAMIVIQNGNYTELRPEVETWIHDKTLGNLAQQTLDSLDRH